MNSKGGHSLNGKYDNCKYNNYSSSTNYSIYLDTAPTRGGFSTYRPSKNVGNRFNHPVEQCGNVIRGRPPKYGNFKSSPPKFVQNEKIVRNFIFYFFKWIFKTQIHSSAQWTRRGSGVFTSDEESETEQISTTEVIQIITPKTVNTVIAEPMAQYDSSLSVDGGISSRQSISTPATLTTTTSIINNNNATNGLMGGFGNFRRGKPVP